MADGKLLHRIVVWPTHEDAAAAEADAANVDCKRSNKLTVWPTYEQAAAHVSIGAGESLLDEDGEPLLDENGEILIED